MTKLVLDTNIVVSAHLKAESLEDRVLKLVFAQRLKLCVSEPILAEYERVLKSPKFSLPAGPAHRSLTLLRRVSVFVQPQQTLAICPHEADNRFLECAEVAGADFLVTGNKRHFPSRWRNTQVVTTRKLLELITPELKK